MFTDHEYDIQRASLGLKCVYEGSKKIIKII